MQAAAARGARPPEGHATRTAALRSFLTLIEAPVAEPPAQVIVTFQVPRASLGSLRVTAPLVSLPLIVLVVLPFLSLIVLLPVVVPLIVTLYLPALRLVGAFVTAPTTLG